MAKPRLTAGKKRPVKRQPTNLDLLRKALGRLTKPKLTELFIRLAQNDRGLQRTLEAELNIEGPASDLDESTRQAILDATKVDTRRLNYNFEYDYKAYEAIAKNFKRMVAAGLWEQVMNHSVELMHKGSYQVECSDEGLMTEDIEECLLPVIRAVGKSGLSPADVFHWCGLMLATDRVGFICREELCKLQASFAEGLMG